MEPNLEHEIDRIVDNELSLMHANSEFGTPFLVFQERMILSEALILKGQHLVCSDPGL